MKYGYQEIGEILKACSKTRKPRLSKRDQVVFPTVECPLPDQGDLTNIEWVVLCELVNSPLIELATK